MQAAGWCACTGAHSSTCTSCASRAACAHIYTGLQLAQPSSGLRPRGWGPLPYRQSSMVGHLATGRSYNEPAELLMTHFQNSDICVHIFFCNFQHFLLVSGIYVQILTKKKTPIEGNRFTSHCWCFLNNHHKKSYKIGCSRNVMRLMITI